MYDDIISSLIDLAHSYGFYKITRLGKFVINLRTDSHNLRIICCAPDQTNFIYFDKSIKGKLIRTKCGAHTALTKWLKTVITHELAKSL